MRPNTQERERLNKVEDEQRQLLRAWHRWHADELAKALDGPHGSLVAGLMERLKRASPRELLAFIEARDWKRIDWQTKLVCLHELNQTIVHRREKLGMPPFDDPLDGEDSLFLRARALLLCSSSDEGLVGTDADGTFIKAIERVNT